jgi:hypothetical protein
MTEAARKDDMHHGLWLSVVSVGSMRSFTACQKMAFAVPERLWSIQ